MLRATILLFDHPIIAHIILSDTPIPAHSKKCHHASKVKLISVYSHRRLSVRSEQRWFCQLAKHLTKKRGIPPNALSSASHASLAQHWWQRAHAMFALKTTFSVAAALASRGKRNAGKLLSGRFANGKWLAAAKLYTNQQDQTLAARTHHDGGHTRTHTQYIWRTIPEKVAIFAVKPAIV